MLKQLELEHKVDLNAPVTKIYLGLKQIKEITIKDLMLHKSGLYKYEASTNIKNLDQAVLSIHVELMIKFIINIVIMMQTI